MPRRRLHEDPRWPRFVAEYAFDLNRFAMEVCGLAPTDQQELMYGSVEAEGSRTSVVSGHGTGKSSGFGVIATWHLLCYFLSNTLLTATKIEQVRAVTWKEIADVKDRIKAGPHAWIADYYEVQAEKVYVKYLKMQWFIVARTAPRGSPENLAGFHREWLLIMVDEASGVENANFNVLTGALTHKNNRLVLASQGTRNNGYFYDTHNSLSSDQGGPFTALRFNSEESPLVSDEWLKEKEAEYGGRDNTEYQIRVLGLFPDNLDGYLLGRSTLERCFTDVPLIGEKDYWGNLVSVDVGAGEYRDDSVRLTARVAGSGDYGEDPRRVEIRFGHATNTRDVTDFTGMVVQQQAELSNPGVLVDAGGMGIIVAQMLEKQCPNVVRVLWGRPCFLKGNKERFVNQRAQCNVAAARAAREGRLVFIGIDQQLRKKILEQGSRIPYGFDEKARYQMMSKEEMRSEGIDSPDVWDAICQLFLEDAVYTVSEHAGAGGRSDDDDWGELEEASAAQS